MTKFILVFALLWSFLGSAEDPFVGHWKIDTAKSQLNGSISSIAAAGPNTWTFHEGAYSWTVKADGTPQSTPFGNTAMKVVDARTWQFANTSNGKPAGTEIWVLSADGKTITWTLTGQKEKGQAFSSTGTMDRIAGKSGFEGTWETTEVQLSFTEVDIAPNGDDGITVTLPEDGTAYSLKFDGKQYPERGPRLPAGVTVSATRTGARTVKAITYLNGKPFDEEEWEVSQDGNTYTYTQRDATSPKPARIILHRMDTH
jgi:hypothetical protein